MYSSGLRLNECATLKPHHIDSKRMKVRVEQGKGKKDRYTILSNEALTYLREYFKRYRPKKWLFEGPHGHLHQRSFGKIVGDAAIRARIDKPISRKYPVNCVF
jgi:site-specific recombinase XerD